ncbi:MAG: Hsp20/alpha crystallin family protein [Candidatus Pacebacteria bacterium]|nr:Hsp20/alpha crystallin family protein [Candidatus Paceibacterota bacterium]MDD5753050.1 Hsp20/alpha crystallin family protein [Candidatus Paceibacterota bacterium]
MALIPFKQLFENEWIESLEDDSLKAPKMDIYETEKEIVAEIEIPGIDPKNIDIEVGDSSLKIETKKETKKEEKNKGYFRKEISTGYYRRIVSLPESIKKEKAVADYENGILKIKIPKIKEGKKLKIKVQEKNTKK